MQELKKFFFVINGPQFRHEFTECFESTWATTETQIPCMGLPEWIFGRYIQSGLQMREGVVFIYNLIIGNERGQVA